ncbi:MAG: signal peptidase I [Candidatus Thorarchaeota archaeon]|nr:signal peptidase I [Candidatus Thorarchaeota archaeon]
MKKARQSLNWSKQPELVKTVFIILIIIGATLGAFGAFTIAMGTSSPLVVVESESMIPNLNVGDLLVLQAHAPEDIIEGNIIVYTADWHDKPIVHRVVERQLVGSEYHYYTKGDNNSARDPGYRIYEDIVGVVVLAIPYLGYITLFLHQPYGLAIVVVIFIALLILPEFLFKEKKDENKMPSEEQASTV